MISRLERGTGKRMFGICDSSRDVQARGRRRKLGAQIQTYGQESARPVEEQRSLRRHRIYK
jgi:hypothetical protein